MCDTFPPTVKKHLFCIILYCLIVLSSIVLPNILEIQFFYSPGSQEGYLGALQPMLPCVTL